MSDALPWRGYIGTQTMRLPSREDAMKAVEFVHCRKPQAAAVFNVETREHWLPVACDGGYEWKDIPAVVAEHRGEAG